MKASRFSLADLLTLLAAVAFSFICFLGLNFVTEGDLLVSILVSIGIMLVLGGLAFMAKWQKTARKDFKGHIILEFSAIVVFTILFFGVSYYLFPHYFTVSSKKDEIKNTLLSSIEGAKKMFGDYEAYATNRESFYKANLNSVVAAKKTRPTDYSDFGFGAEGISDDVQIENKLFTLHADLFPTNYSDTVSRKGIKDVATKWLNEQTNVVSQWKPIGIPIVANELSDKASEWLSDLTGYSKIREKGEIADDYSYELSFGDVSPLLTEMERPKFLPIILSVVLWAVMLFSWLITKRDTRFPGFKRVFGKEKVLDNEL